MRTAHHPAAHSARPHRSLAPFTNGLWAMVLVLSTVSGIALYFVERSKCVSTFVGVAVLTPCLTDPKRMRRTRHVRADTRLTRGAVETEQQLAKSSAQAAHQGACACPRALRVQKCAPVLLEAPCSSQSGAGRRALTAQRAWPGRPRRLLQPCAWPHGRAMYCDALRLAAFLPRGHTRVQCEAGCIFIYIRL